MEAGINWDHGPVTRAASARPQGRPKARAHPLGGSACVPAGRGAVITLLDALQLAN